MGKSYLIDTNAAIELIAGKLPTLGEEWLDKVLLTEAVYTSIINRIELLGFDGPSAEMNALSAFVEFITVLPLTDEIADKAIEIRIQKSIKLPDAVIAATALIHDLTVISRNTKDFSGIENLEVINPYELKAE